jgi:hypothetical protein
MVICKIKPAQLLVAADTHCLLYRVQHPPNANVYCLSRPRSSNDPYFCLDTNNRATSDAAETGTEQENVQNDNAEAREANAGLGPLSR